MKTIMILGGDGYLGWSVALDRALKSDDRVILVDGYLKRNWQKQVGIEELYPVPYLNKRVDRYKAVTGKRNLDQYSVDISNYQLIENIIERFKPDVIINAAQQPSAPYSMIDPEKASFTLSNNVKTCLNTLWAVAKHCPETLIISVGSAGVYLSIDADFIPKSKVNSVFYHDSTPHIINNTWLPMQASDFYHQSKAHSFSLTDIAVKLWNLRAVTVQQSTIFGHCIDEKLNHPDLLTRFNYDHIFGTVLNRFICQAAIQYPLTVYGDGSHTTGLCDLCDAVKVYNSLIDSDVPLGSHLVEHSYTSMISVLDIAKYISSISKTEIQFIENPRKEVALTRKKEMEENTSIKHPVQFDQCIAETFSLAQQYKNNIQKEYILPTINWRI